MKQNDADNLIAAYTKAYTRTTGKTIAVTHYKGWFTLDTVMGGTSRVSGKKLTEMYATLQTRPDYSEVRKKRLEGGSEQMYVGLTWHAGYHWEVFQARPEDATAAKTIYVAVTDGFPNRSEAEALAEQLNLNLVK